MKKILSYLILCVLIPCVVVLGAVAFRNKQTAWISLCVAVLSVLPFFFFFEWKRSDAGRLVLIAAMTALSVVGRMAFSPLPGFKPVAAVVILTGMYFGSEAGFMTGALSAVISNFYFGQGPWTPFQMLSWGVLGFLAGIIAVWLQKSKIVLMVYAILSGILYSFLMDVYTVLQMDGYFNFYRYLGALASAAPFTAVYAVSNLIFLLLFAGPIGKILKRIQTKYML